MPTASEEQEPTPQEQKSIVQRTWQSFKDVPTLWKGVGAVATTLATILSILPWLDPSLQPQPPSSETWAALSNVKEGPHVRLREYIQRPRVPAERRRDAETMVSEEDKERVGSIVYFDLEAEGYEGEPIHIVWTLYEVDSGTLISSGLANQKAWPFSLIEPLSQSRGLELETWVPLPQGREEPFVVGLDVFGSETEGPLANEEVIVNP